MKAADPCVGTRLQLNPEEDMCVEVKAENVWGELSFFALRILSHPNLLLNPFLLLGWLVGFHDQGKKHIYLVSPSTFRVVGVYSSAAGKGPLHMASKSTATLDPILPLGCPPSGPSPTSSTAKSHPELCPT